MGIISSTTSALTASLDAVSNSIEGLAIEATRWSKRRTTTQILRDEQYVKEQLADLQKARNKFAKLVFDKDLIEAEKKILKALAQ